MAEASASLRGRDAVAVASCLDPIDGASVGCYRHLYLATERQEAAALIGHGVTPVPRGVPRSRQRWARTDTGTDHPGRATPSAAGRTADIVAQLTRTKPPTVQPEPRMVPRRSPAAALLATVAEGLVRIECCRTVVIHSCRTILI